MAALVAFGASTVAACGPTVGPSTPTTSSTTSDDTTASTPTADDASTSPSGPTTDGPTTDGPTTSAADDSTGAGPIEYVGFWSQNYTDTPKTVRSFAPCGEAGPWLIEGALPELEACSSVDSMYLRVMGELLPSPGGGSPTLVVSEVLEGPCWQHSCDGGDPCDCTTFEALCALPPSPCDLFFQSCPEGEKCMPWANDGGTQWSATRCSPLADGPGQVGDPCTVEGSQYSGIDDCDLGSMCWNVDAATSTGTCVALCDSNQCQPELFCEDPGTACAIVDDGVVPVCLPMCDPLAPDCVPGYGCQETANGFFCIP